MKRLGPAAEFEHLPQHRDALLRRSLAEDIQHGAHGVGIGGVAIVIYQNALLMKTLAAHSSGSKIPDSFGQPLRRDAAYSGHCNAGQEIQDGVAAGEGALEADLVYAKLDSAGNTSNIPGVNVRFLRPA